MLWTLKEFDVKCETNPDIGTDTEITSMHNLYSCFVEASENPGDHADLCEPIFQNQISFRQAFPLKRSL